jgi:hypothetical protein
MLGEYLGELKGKITSRRVLDVTNCPNLEVNVTREGKLKDGSDTTTFTGEGIGHYAGSAKLKYAGSNLFGPSKGKLEFLNNSVLIFEIDIDLETLDDNIKLWEWK